MKKNIDNLIKNIIRESLHEKNEAIVSKIKSKMDEWNPNEPVTISAQSSDIHEMEEGDVCEQCGGEMMEGECTECGSKMYEEMDEELHGNQKKLDVAEPKGKITGADFKKLRSMKKEDMDEEMEEGNAFTGALAKAKESGKKEFDIDGKKYHVKEGKKKVEEKWEDDVDVEKSGEYADMSIEKINSAIKTLKTKNEKYKEEGKKVPEANKTKMSQLYFAKRAKQGWKGKGKTKVNESIQLTESEMINLIEKIVLEQKKAKGMAETEKVLKADKKENDQALKAVTKKMSDYVKKGSNGDYTMEPKKFPQGNNTLKKDTKVMKYNPSKAVDEYIDAFAYPGMTNLVFDEIKPDDKKIEKYLKGHKTTGNAQVDEDGKALGNVVPSEVGEKFYKNYEDNLYGQEQMNASYKRQPQPVDSAGENSDNRTLKSIKGKKAQSILNKLDETKNETNTVLNEEFEKE